MRVYKLWLSLFTDIKEATASTDFFSVELFNLLSDWELDGMEESFGGTSSYAEAPTRLYLLNCMTRFLKALWTSTTLPA